MRSLFLAVFALHISLLWLAACAAAEAGKSPPQKVTTVEGITEWLAELTQSALDTVLVLDEANRLSPAAFEALAYVLRNLPPNLRVLIGMRGEMPAGLEDLVAYGAEAAAE